MFPTNKHCFHLEDNRMSFPKLKIGICCQCKLNVKTSFKEPLPDTICSGELSSQELADELRVENMYIMTVPYHVKMIIVPPACTIYRNPQVFTIHRCKMHKMFVLWNPNRLEEHNLRFFQIGKPEIEYMDFPGMSN